LNPSLIFFNFPHTKEFCLNNQFFTHVFLKMLKNNFILLLISTTDIGICIHQGPIFTYITCIHSTHFRGKTSTIGRNGSLNSDFLHLLYIKLVFYYYIWTLPQKRWIYLYETHETVGKAHFLKISV
jgi:hypothetical protein